MRLPRQVPHALVLLAGALLTACHPGPDGATAASAPAASEPAATAGASKTPMTTATDGATSEYTVTAADLQALLSGQDGADLETVSRDGKPAAMRVFGVRPGSVAARLGAQNGDQIESINDVSVATAGATNQWTQMATRDGRLTIRGVRAGKPFTTVLKVEGR